MNNNLKPAVETAWLNESASTQFRLEMRPYTFKEICSLYQLNYRAMKTMLKPLAGKLGKRHGIYYSVRQLETIINLLGPPYIITENTPTK